MKRIIYALSWLFVWNLLSSCGPDESNLFERPFSGNANFDRFIVVGDGFTAGYMDGALYQSGQASSIGNLLAMQMEETSNSVFPFIQPDIQGEFGFGGYDSANAPLGKFALQEVEELNALMPFRLPGQEPNFFNEDTRILGNFSVPEAKVLDALVPGYATANLFYARFASSFTSSTIIGDAANAAPTFFVFWMGYRDVLNYAMNGATGRDGGISRNDMTSVDNFRVTYQAAINGLLATGASGMLVNLPDIIHLPFFNTLPYNAIYTTQQDSIDLWNYYFDYNIAVTGWNRSLDFQGLPPEEIAEKRRSFIVFNADDYSPVVIEDPSLSDASIPMPDGSIFEIPKIRQLTPGEMLLYSFPYEQLANGMGTINPTPKRYALSLEEIERIRARISDFNRIIKDVVDNNPNRLGFIDIRADVREFFGGFPSEINGVPIEPTFLPQFGAFSIDGVHFNARGNAHFANKMIEEINTRFQSNLFFIDVNQYEGNAPPL